MRYICECLDSGSEFNAEALLITPADVSTPSLTEPPPGLEISKLNVSEDDLHSPSEHDLYHDHIRLDVDLFMKSSRLAMMSTITPPIARGRAASIHSMVECLLYLLGGLLEPLIPVGLHVKCINDGSLSPVAAKQTLEYIPQVHRNMFVYVMQFLREFMKDYTGPGGLNPELLGETRKSV
jgi:hypothetical protein